MESLLSRIGEENVYFGLRYVDIFLGKSWKEVSIQENKEIDGIDTFLKV